MNTKQDPAQSSQEIEATRVLADHGTETYEFEGYTLELGYEGKVSDDIYMKPQVAYRLTGPDGDTIFIGYDFGSSPMYDSDGPENAANLLGFLIMLEHDIEPEYFAAYTPRQLEFRDNEAEDLYYWLELLYPEEYKD